MSDQPDAFDFEVTGDPSRTVVRMRGDVDLRTSPPLRERLLEVIESRPKRIILDLTGVEYMDSSGVGTVVELKRRMDRVGGEIILVGMQERVRSVFEITRLDNFFRIVPTLEEVGD